MPRVLYVIHRSWPYLGGSERYFFEVARRTVAAGGAATVLTTDAWDVEHLHWPRRRRVAELAEQRDGVQIRRFRVRHFPYDQFTFHTLSRLAPTRYPLFDAPHSFIPGLRWFLATTRDRYDVVHAGVFPHTSMVAAAAHYCRRQDVPFVCQPMLNLGEPHAAAANPHFLNPKQLSLLRRADAILTNTDFEDEMLHAKGILADKVTVASPAVTTSEVLGGNGAAFRARHRVAGPLVLQVSTQTFDKGSLHTVEALKLLWQRGWPAELVLIGQVLTDFADYLARLPPAVRERVRVLGYADEQEKKDALAACDVFVMPSRADSFGLVYLEAWLYRKPVIGCFAGGVPRVIGDGRNGFLVPFGATVMLAEHLAALLGNPALRARLGEDGARQVLERYTWEHTYPRIARVYEALMQRGTSHAKAQRGQEDAANGPTEAPRAATEATTRRH